MNRKANISMILGIVGLVFFLFAYGIVSFIILFALGIAAIIYSAIAKKEMEHTKNKGKGKGKGQATAGLVMGIIIVVFTLFALLGYIMITNVDVSSAIYCPKEMGMVNNCVKKDEKTATCELMGVGEIPCYLEVLDDSQMKKIEE